MRAIPCAVDHAAVLQPVYGAHVVGVGTTAPVAEKLLVDNGGGQVGVNLDREGGREGRRGEGRREGG